MHTEFHRSTHFVFASLVTVALLGATGAASAADQKGKVRSHVKNGLFAKTVKIEVSDPDGIAWYKIYETSNGKKTGKALPQSRSFDCDDDPPTVDVADLDAANHLHLHHVDFKDCDGNDEAWLANKLTGEPTKGKDLNADTGDQQIAVQFGDVNQDTIVDLVTVLGDAGGVTVGVLLGNGDGTFSAPSADYGTLLRVPSLGVEQAESLPLPGDRSLGFDPAYTLELNR